MTTAMPAAHPYRFHDHRGRRCLVLLLALSLVTPVLAPAPAAAQMDGEEPAYTAERVNVSPSGEIVTDWFAAAGLSADGRYVAFTGDGGSGLVAEGSGFRTQGFVRDLVTDTTQMFTVANDGSQADNNIENLVLSRDGRSVAFDSFATNLVPDDTGNNDVFVRDLETGFTRRVSVGPDGAERDAYSDAAQLSGDGRLVVFASFATSGEDGFTDRIHLADLTHPEDVAVREVSVLADGEEAHAPAISADGSTIAYVISSSDDVDPVTWTLRVHDLAAGTTRETSLGEDFFPNQIEPPSLSADGRVVAYLVPTADAGGALHVWDLDGDTVVEVPAPASQPYRSQAVLTDDGRRVVFQAVDVSPIADGPELAASVWVHDLDRGTTELVSAPYEGANHDTTQPAVSADARIVAYSGRAETSFGRFESARHVFVARAVDREPPTFPASAELRTEEVASTLVRLAWDAAVDDAGVTAYRVLQDGVPLVQVESSSSSHLVEGLEPGATYTFGLEALDAAGNASARLTVEVTTAAGQSAGDSPLFTTAGPGQVSLRWETATGGTVSGYRVSRAEGDDGFAVVADLPAGQTSHVDRGLFADTTYRYLVSGLVDGQPRPHTVAASVTTPALTIEEVSWSSPRLPTTLVAPLGESVTITVTGESQRQATALVTAEQWFDAEGTLLETPQPREVVVELVETATPGTYTGLFELVEGTAAVTAITGRIGDGRTEIDQPADRLPLRVGAAVVGSLDAPDDALPDARLSLWSDAVSGGDQVAVEGGGPFALVVPSAPEGSASYGLRLVTGEGRVALEASELTVAAGRTLDLGVLEPQLPTSLLVRVVDEDGETRSGTRVQVTDAASGTYLGGGWTNWRGEVTVRGLRWGTEITARALIDVREYSDTAVSQILEVGQNELTLTRVPRPRSQLSGRITTLAGVGIAHADITVIQTVDGSMVTTRAGTDDDGRYSVEVLQAPADVRIRHSQYAPFEGEVTVTDEPAVVDAVLLGEESYAVNVLLYTRQAGGNWEGPQPLDWRTAVHFRLRGNGPFPGRSWSPYSQTVRVRGYPGQTIEVCGDGAEAGVGAGCVAATLGEDPTVPVDLELRLDQAGRVTGELATIDGSPFAGPWQVYLQPVRADGRRIAVRPVRGIGDRFEVPVAMAGEHHIRVIGGTHGRPRAELRLDLEEGVTDLGRIVLGAAGPFQGAGNEVRPLRPELPPGGVAEYRTSYRNDGADLDDGILRLEVPAGTELLAASVLRDGTPVRGEVVDGFLEVPLGDLPSGATGVVRHQIRLVDTGLERVATAAYVRHAGSDPAGPGLYLGAGTVTVAGVSLVAPSSTASAAVTVSGRAAPDAPVSVYDGDLLIGEVTTTAGGFWRADVLLADRGRGHEHALHAESTLDGEVVRSEVSHVLFDDTRPVMTEISMAQSDGRRVVFDPRDGVARFPYVWVPARPMLVDVAFDTPEQVADVRVRIGAVESDAVRGEDGRFRASVPAHGRGQLFVDFDVVPPPLDLNGDSGLQPPTVEELRGRLPAGIADFGAPTVDAPANSGAGQATVPWPAFGTEAEAAISIGMTRGISYTPTSDDRDAQRATGAPVYGLQHSSTETSDRLTVQISAYIPESELPLEGGEAEALAYLGQALATPVSTARGEATQPLLTQANVAVPAVRFSFEVAFIAANTIDGSYKAWNSDGKYKRMQRLLGLLDACPPDVISLYTNRLDSLARSAMILDTAMAAMALGAVLIGPATFGLGTLALWGATYGVSTGVDLAVAHNLDELAAEIRALDCGEDDEDDDEDADPIWIHDPSGYVYEGVTSNRLEGVTTTAQYSPTPDGPWSVWNADWFGQTNPLTTDANGRYAWDVPEGYWRVVYELDGYQTAYSDVLEVLPPQLDVNEGLVSLTAPTLEHGAADTDGVELHFSQHMIISTVTGQVEVAGPGGLPVAGTLQPLDEEEAPSGLALARTFRFAPTDPLDAGDQLRVTINALAQNYARRTLQASETVDVVVQADPAGPAEPGGDDGSEDTGRVRRRLAAGGTIATLATGERPRPGTPGLAVTTPSAGWVTITPTADDGAPAGLTLLAGGSWDIVAPAASTDAPMRIAMSVHAGDVAGATGLPTLRVLRDGVELADCAAPAGAVAPPCVDRRELIGGVVTVTVLTPEASRWSLALPVADDPPCPPGTVGEGRYDDVPAAHSHVVGINCAAALSLTRGRTPTSFDPGGTVTRGQMASFLARTIEAADGALPAEDDRFDDDDGSVHESAINALATAGIVNGRTARTFEPQAPVSRAQMATLFVRTRAHLTDRTLTSAPDAFGDDDGTVHEDAIDRAALAGLVRGRTTARYEPHAPMLRGQMATTLVRFLESLAQDGDLGELRGPIGRHDDISLPKAFRRYLLA